MTDETQPPAPHEAPPFVGLEPPPPPEPPRSPVGWLVSGVMLFLLTIMSVAAYFGPPDGEKSFADLQRNLQYSVSIDPDSYPGAKGAMRQQREEALEGVLEDAVAESDKSDEAARVALGAARELGEEPPQVALDRLRESDDRASFLVGKLHREGLSASEREELAGMEESDFATQLAAAQAEEEAGAPSSREEIVDKSLPLRYGAMTVGSIAIALMGLVALVSFISFRAGGKFVATGVPEVDGSTADRYMCRFAFYLVAYLGIQFVLAGVVQVLGDGDVGAAWLSPLALVLTLLAVIVFLQVPVLGNTDTTAEIVRPKPPFLKQVAIGVYGYLCTVPLLVVVLIAANYLTQFLPEPSHPISEVIAQATAMDWVAIFLTAAVLAPLVEEFAFRGMFFPALAVHMKPWVAMALCGVLFAAIHPQGPLLWPALAATGAAAAALRYYTGSLVPSIVLHMVHNGLIVAAALFVG